MIKALCFILLFSIQSKAQLLPDWSEGAIIPAEGRANIHQWPDNQWQQKIDAGKIHAQLYPVKVTGALPPYYPLNNFLKADDSNLLRRALQKIGRSFSGYRSFDDVLKNLGLHPYPAANETGIYAVPYPNNTRPDYRMGVGSTERSGAVGFTFSCATCHSSNLFGKTVLGMTNRFPRANDFFVQVKDITPYVNLWLFQKATKATDAEVALLKDSLNNLKRVEVKKPIVLGLDTSLAQVALSLNKRFPDQWATPNEYYEKNPRPDAFLDHKPADSKPAVWWNLKYKNRWLSDGSVLSGNPIVTNILWNEVGRGTDLRQLDKWISENQKLIDEITTAVFATEAPRITDFFSEEQIDLAGAIRGEVIFNQTCARCHGTYEKAWNQANTLGLSKTELIKTTAVNYKKQTPVVDVGTDPYRRQGMKSLEVLNTLAISKKFGVKVQAQNGYVPPPLVGIWARWPYMHNNSIPNLCALLTPSAQRPKVYYAGAANNQKTDFDFDCNGYPLAEKTPKNWIKDVLRYDTRRPGMSNSGHDVNIFIKDGKEILSSYQKKDLIKFLQTL